MSNMSTYQKSRATSAKASQPPKLGFDGKPPVVFRHQLLDMGNIAMSFFFTAIFPALIWRKIDEYNLGIWEANTVVLVYITLQYWVQASYFMITESLGLCDDMFALDPSTRISFWHGAPTVMKNQLISNTLCLFVVSSAWIHSGKSLQPEPSALQIFGWNAFAGIVVSEFMMYTTHRLLHTPALMWAHKIHHEMNSVSLTISWGARYCSVFEDLFVNIGTIVTAAFCTSLHPLNLLVWVSHSQWNVICNHTGYYEKYLPVSAALTGMIHHNHHLNSNVDFGATAGWTDWLFGTKSDAHPGSIIVAVLDGIWIAVTGHPKPQRSVRKSYGADPH